MVEEYRMDDAEICVVAFGIAARVSKNAINAAREQGIKVGLIRPITLWPFPEEHAARRRGSCQALHLAWSLRMGQMIEDVSLPFAASAP